MQIWNLLHAARWKHRTQKSRQKSPSRHHRTTLSGYVFATSHVSTRYISTIGKNLLSSNMSSKCPPQYGELRPTSGWDRSGSLRHPCKFQWVSRLGSVTARHVVYFYVYTDYWASSRRIDDFVDESRQRVNSQAEVPKAESSVFFSFANCEVYSERFSHWMINCKQILQIFSVLLMCSLKCQMNILCGWVM